MSFQVSTIGITILYLIGAGIIAAYVRRSARTATGFTDGGRHFPASLIGFLMVSEFIGTAVSVGTAQVGYLKGISAAWNVVGLAVGFLLFGLFLAQKYKELGLNTISGVLAARYGQSTRIAASILTICALEIIAVSIYASGGAVLSGILSISKVTAVVAVGVLSVAYVSVGGMRSVVYTNVLHASIKYVGILLALGYGLFLVGGPEQLWGRLPTRMFAWDTVGWSQVGAWMIAGIGSIFATQHVIQAIHTVPDAKAAQRACFYCAGAMIPFGIAAALIGMTAAALHPGISALQAFPSIIAEMDRLTAGIVVAGLAASLFGTISAVSIGSATLLQKDFFDPIFNSGKDEHRSLLFLRAATVFVGLFPVVIALGTSNVLHIAYLGKGLRASLAVLVLLAFYAPRFSTGVGAFLGIVISLPVTIGWYILGDPFGIDNAYLAFLVPVLVMGIVHLMSPGGSQRGMTDKPIASEIAGESADIGASGSVSA